MPSRPNTMTTQEIVLKGRRVVLEALSVQHRKGLITAINDGELWTIKETKVPFIEEVDEFIQAALDGAEHGTDLAFAIIDRSSGAVVGSTRYMKIFLDHRRLEIGYTFLAKSWQRTYINTETKYLLLKHAFEKLGVNRVQFLTGSKNFQSQTALERLGAKREGVMRQHMILRDGWIRDSVIYSIIVEEWPGIKRRLEAKLR